MSREEYQENPRYLLRNALENASARLSKIADAQEILAAHNRSEAHRIAQLATNYGTTPRRRLLARRIPAEESYRAQESAHPLQRDERLTG
jgi:hypothetical protein